MPDQVEAAPFTRPKESQSDQIENSTETSVETPVETQTEAEAQFELIRAAYLVRLPGKMAAVEAAWQSLDLVSMHRLCHGLVGSGGSYGFFALSITARQLEQYLVLLLTKNALPTEEQRAEVFALLAALSQAIETIA